MPSLEKNTYLRLENEINDVNLSQDGCVAREDGLLMARTAEPLSTCVPSGLGTPSWNSPDGATCLRGANGKTAPRVRKATDLVENLR